MPSILSKAIIPSAIICSSIAIFCLMKKKKQIIHQEPDEQIDENEQKIMQEQLTRNIQFFGEEGQKKIQDSYVVVAGIGGVGSHLTICLARSGVRKIKIIDFDRITLSSLNRHGFATRQDVGFSKVQSTANYVKKIFPKIEIIICEDYITKENVQKFLDDKPDYIVDCIDNKDAKVELLYQCVTQNIQVISSCGAGMKCDPTRIQIQDISKTNNDSLAKSIRKALKAKGVYKGIKMVYSEEISDMKLMPLKEHQKDDPNKYKVYDNYRLRTIPVMGCMPALIGYSMASYILCQLAGHKINPYNMDDHTSQVQNILKKACDREAKVYNVHKNEIIYDIHDMYILAREVLEWKCAVCQKHCGAEPSRFDPNQQASIENILLFCPKHTEIQRKFKNIQDVQDHYGLEIFQKLKSYLQEAINIDKQKHQMFI